MKRIFILFVLLAISLSAAAWDPAASADRASVEKFAAAHVGRTDAPPFSFIYGGKRSGEFIAGWKTTAESQPGSDRTVRTVVYTDPSTGLRVTAT